MWRLISLCLLATAAVWAQAANPEGVWNSDERYNGETRVVIVIRATEGKLGGTVTMRGVMDDDNNASTLNLIIESAKLDQGNLTFQTKLPDENVTEWEMTISGSTATASIVGDHDGPYSDPQSWKMKRAESSNTSAALPSGEPPARDTRAVL